MAESGTRRYRLVAVGVSTGAMGALKRLIGALPADFPLPVVVVLHLGSEAGSGMAQLLDELCAIRVKEADHLELPAPGTVYLAPANYHLLLERDGSFALSADPPVNFSRPSVDVLFESAAFALGSALVGVVLTGAGDDGSVGVRCIKEMGGTVVVQDPQDARAGAMPRHALQAVDPDHIVTLATLPQLLINLSET